MGSNFVLYVFVGCLSSARSEHTVDLYKYPITPVVSIGRQEKTISITSFWYLSLVQKDYIIKKLTTDRLILLFWCSLTRDLLLFWTSDIIFFIFNILCFAEIGYEMIKDKLKDRLRRSLYFWYFLQTLSLVSLTRYQHHNAMIGISAKPIVFISLGICTLRRTSIDDRQL